MPRSVAKRAGWPERREPDVRERRHVEAREPRRPRETVDDGPEDRRQEPAEPDRFPPRRSADPERHVPEPLPEDEPGDDRGDPGRPHESVDEPRALADRLPRAEQESLEDAAPERDDGEEDEEPLAGFVGAGRDGRGFRGSRGRSGFGGFAHPPESRTGPPTIVPGVHSCIVFNNTRMHAWHEARGTGFRSRPRGIRHGSLIPRSLARAGVRGPGRARRPRLSPRPSTGTGWVSRGYMIAVGGAGSSAAPALPSGT